MIRITPITLIAPHTHAGQTLQPGDIAHVPEPIADWLIRQGVARLTPETEPVKSRPPHKALIHAPANLMEGN